MLARNYNKINPAMLYYSDNGKIQIYQGRRAVRLRGQPNLTLF